MKYPNWEYGYEDFIDQYEPEIVIERNEIAEVGNREIWYRDTTTDEDGNKVILRTRYTRRYGLVASDETFKSGIEAHTLEEWIDIADEPGADTKYEILENWLVCRNLPHEFTPSISFLGGAFVVDWWSDEKEPSLDGMEFNYVFVVALTNTPSRSIKARVNPSSRRGFRKCLLQGIMESSIRDITPGSDDEFSGRKMDQVGGGIIDYNGTVEKHIVGGTTRNNIANYPFIVAEYGLDIPDIDVLEEWDEGILTHLPYPQIISGMRGAFPGYEYIQEPVIHFPRTQLWWGVNDLGYLNFSSLVGEPINTTIRTEKDLSNISYGNNGTFILANDLEISQLPGIHERWNSVIRPSLIYNFQAGYEDYLAFNLYGNNHKITVVGSYSYGGLVGKYRGGTIRDMIIENARIFSLDGAGVFIDQVRYDDYTGHIPIYPTNLINVDAVDCVITNQEKHDWDEMITDYVGVGGLIGKVNDGQWKNF